MRYLSPLRYPGGKARLAPYLSRLIRAQNPRPRQYAEPFAGGAGAALHLLRNDNVEGIHLNDLNPGIAAFWRASLDYPYHFCRLVETVPLTIDEWHRQADIYANPARYDDFELGFATFYLNRTNRSGILDARPIGGFQQLGRWKIDARFNREALCSRIQAIADLRDRIFVTEYDALDFLNGMQDIAKDVFVYVDPPYLVQGQGLYLHALDTQAHLELARLLASAEFPWLLTYDDDPRITSLLYDEVRCATFDISHTAHRQHVGTETVIYSANLAIPDLEIFKGHVARLTG